MDNNYNNLNNLNNLNDPQNQNNNGVNNNINNANNVNTVYDTPEHINSENKKVNKYIIIFSVIFFGLLVLIGYLTYVRLVESTNRKNNAEPVEVKKDFNIAIPAIREDIMYKTQSILGVKYQKSTTSFNTSGYSFNYGIFNSTSLSEKDMKLIALNTARREFAEKISIDKEDINVHSILEYWDLIEESEDTDSFFQLDENRVTNIYKELFNKDINHSDVSSCPYYFYDKNNNVYYGAYMCGGTSMVKYLTYLDNVYYNEDEAYIEIYIGLIDAIPSGSRYSYVLYDSINKNNVLKDLSTDDFLIEEDNKADFSSYRLLFKADDKGNYYFDRIEKNDVVKNNG